MNQLGLGVSQGDWTITFDLVVNCKHHNRYRIGAGQGLKLNEHNCFNPKATPCPAPKILTREF